MNGRLGPETPPSPTRWGQTPMSDNSPPRSQLSTGLCVQVEEPAYTRRKVGEFLRSHTCYELIPESGKVVLLDLDLPVRQVSRLQAGFWRMSHGCWVQGLGYTI